MSTPSIPPTSYPRILILGHGQTGKDTIGTLLAEYGFTCTSRSSYATSTIMLPHFHAIGMHYPSPEACYADRLRFRTVWFDQIEQYNAGDGSRLTREMLDDGFNVVIGMRSAMEFEASRHLFDYVFWVDASERVSCEDTTSNQMTRYDAQAVIDNNGTLDDLHRTITGLATMLLPPIRKVSV